jgi:hypothetical protein
MLQNGMLQNGTRSKPETVNNAMLHYGTCYKPVHFITVHVTKRYIT